MTYHELDTLVATARKAMIETMNKGPHRTFPGEAPYASRRKPSGKARLPRNPGSGLILL